MANYLLIGAGFSRNWGGWLAAEAFEYLLGCPEITIDKRLGKLLWAHQFRGGFESALTELQTAYCRDPLGNQAALEGFQAALTRMFSDMNSVFLRIADWEFQQDIERKVSTFLTRFDAIFTLNQDVLLEHHYVNDNIALLGKKHWNGAQLPGMCRVPPEEAIYSGSWARSTWYPSDESSFKIEKNLQPIFKLHGSSNWRHADSRPMLIMGGAKANEIEQTTILRWYAKNFESCLLGQSSRLMVIGYGFQDEHINAIISRGVEEGLKLFVVAPDGAEIARRLNSTRNNAAIAVPTPLEGLLETALIGASRRSMREIFGADMVEYNKVMRFFYQ